MKNKAISLLKQLTEAHSVPGYEDEVREIFVNELQAGATISCDKMGGVYAQQSAEQVEEGTPRVLLAGHMDEVGFRVQSISYDGFVKFLAVGGWWSHTLLSQRVEIKTQSGEKVLGVVASKPPHFLSASERNNVLPLEAMVIDVGASSREEAERVMGISIGDPIAPKVEFSPMSKEGYYMAKAFDNRVGMAGVIQTFQALSEKKLPNQFVACGTVQEEVGLRGALVAAAKEQPDVVIVLEGPPADDGPGSVLLDAQGKLGGGVQIRLQDPTAIMNPRLVEFVIETAEREGIRYQTTMRSSGGTDAGSFHKANEGIPCIVLGTPARYIHSHNAVIDISDYLEMVRLSKALIERLDKDAVDRFTSYL